MPNRKPYITLIIAPEIPTSEIPVLRAHYHEAMSDPSYAVVVNYELRVDEIETPRGGKMVVIAPGIPASELGLLRLKISDARAAKKQADRLVVLNYEARIDVIA